MKHGIKKRLFEALLPLFITFLAARIVWCVAAIIGIGGISLSFFYNDWSMFSRSGALIVVCALLLALLDYTSSTKKFFDKVREILGPKYQDDEKERVRHLVLEEMKKYGLTRSEKEIAYLADKKLESFWEGFPNRMGETLKMKSVISEVSLAIIGTLIWGFGDLFGK